MPNMRVFNVVLRQKQAHFLFGRMTEAAQGCPAGPLCTEASLAMTNSKLSLWMLWPLGDVIASPADLLACYQTDWSQLWFFNSFVFWKYLLPASPWEPHYRSFSLNFLHVSSSCHNKMSQARWLPRTGSSCLGFFRLKVQDKVLVRLVPSTARLGGRLLLSSSDEWLYNIFGCTTVPLVQIVLSLPSAATLYYRVACCSGPQP